MAHQEDEVQELQRRLAGLTARVYRLEQRLGLEPEVPVEPRREAVVPAEAAATPLMQPIPVAPPGEGQPVVPSALAPAAAAESLESVVGGRWLNRVGIFAVFIGAFYFLTYAIENKWIGPAGQVTIGLLAGMGVIAWSEKFRQRGYRFFALSLKAVGIGVLYLSLWASFQYYHLVPASVAFLGMVIVTAATAAISIRQDSEVLAAFALLGGYLTPVLVSTGMNRAVELFSYVALLDVATVVLTVFRPWRRLLLGSFLGTLLLYVGWYDQFYDQSQMLRTFGFATLFFAIFASVPVVRSLRRAGEGGRAEAVSPVLIGLTLINAATYFLQAYDLLHHLKPDPMPGIAVCLGALYLILAWQLRRDAEAEQSPAASLIPLLHVALAVGFLTIAIPLKLERHWITLGWLAESGLLLYVSYRTRSELLYRMGIAALALGVLRLLLYDNFYVETLVFNWRFLTYGAAIAVLAGVIHMAQREGEHGLEIALPIIAINLLALFALHYEIADYFARRTAEITQTFGPGSWQYTSQWRTLTLARDFTYSAVWMIYGAGLLSVGFWKRSAFLRWQALILLAVTIVKVFTYDVSQLEKGYRIMSLIALGVLLLGISFVYQRDWLKLSTRSRAAERSAEGGTP
ncbi:MAG TPA: DUF2339 domain-containing protein [Terriglobales bacterium]|nr:DUF2339 domain-containing protein [Terriglobales bacterium]